MMHNDNETIRHLIRLANDSNIDPQSRKAICAMAEHVRNLHNVSRKISDLDKQLQQFRSSDRLRN